jgi:hypothetical protein
LKRRWILSRCGATAAPPWSSGKTTGFATQVEDYFVSFFRLAAFLLLLACFDASAETLTCTEVNAIPFTITAPGSYCLTKDLATSQPGGGGILINASDVTLDCNDHLVRNSNNANEDVGIASGGRSGVTIRNCRIKGFQEGIHFDTRSYDITIRDNEVLNSGTYGIVVWGSKVQILDNSVLDTKYASTVRDYNQSIVVTAYEPGVLSRDVVVRGNRVLGLFGTSVMQAIRVDMATSPLIQNNHVGQLVPKTGGRAYAIMTSGAVNPLISGNILTSTAAIQATGIASESSSVCLDNVIVGLRASGLDACGLSQGNVAK